MKPHRSICKCCKYFREVWTSKKKSKEEWWCQIKESGYIVNKYSDELPFGCPMDLEQMMKSQNQ